MAVKVYSDVTKKFYEDVAAAEKAEKELVAKKDAEIEARKQAAKEVEEKRKAFDDARKGYYEALSKFCDKYGTYHMSWRKGDWEKFWDEFWNW